MNPFSREKLEPGRRPAGAWLVTRAGSSLAAPTLVPRWVWALALIGWLAAGPWLAAARESIVPRYREGPLTKASLAELLGRVSRFQEQRRAALQAKGQAPDKIAQDGVMLACRLILDQGKALAAADPATAGPEAQCRFVELQRLAFSIEADLEDIPEPLLGTIRRGAPAILQPGAYSTIARPVDPRRPLGLEAARREASWLYHPDGRGPVTVAELAAMNHFEVSRLQPRPGHPGFDSGGMPGFRYRAFLHDLTQRLRQQGKKTKAFDLTRSTRVQFLRKIRESGSTPKFESTDRYGVKWKGKWGREVHTDSVAARLMLEVGGSFADLTLPTAPGAVLLVFAPPRDQDPAAIRTFAQFAAVFRRSMFRFDPTPYLLERPRLVASDGTLLGSGRIDAELAAKEGIPEEYIGAYYALFHELQLSLFDPTVHRLGGAPINGLGADTDRVARGALVFNAWIDNPDIKEDNARVALLPNPATGAWDRVVEYLCDLGCSLGAGGGPAGLKYRKGDPSAFGASMLALTDRQIRFRYRPLFPVKPWQQVTWADGRWMARQIARLTRSHLEDILADSGWPVFVQRLYTEKLLARRNELVEAFQLEEEGFRPIPCDPMLTITVKLADGSTEEVVRAGRLNRASRLVRHLEATHHPEGLANLGRGD